ncbi:MAG: NTP transferase domain-containing protein [Chloroflexi bacterium]|nr:NTP transferase domain-containing protein [Chloroflexota bacterium]
MHCVVTAGGLPKPEDPLYAYTEGKTKALLKMGSRTMLEHVIDALQTSTQIEDIVVVGLGSDLGMTFKRPVDHIPDHGSLIGNVIAGIHRVKVLHPDAKVVVLSSADIPLINGNMIDEFITSCAPYDRAIYYNFVDKETMEARFPGSNRTFVKLQDTQIAGGDLLIAHADLADDHHDLWEAATEARKHAWKLARIVGFRFLFKFLTKRVKLLDLEDTIFRILNRPVKVILSPFAELAMDADKPNQVDLLRKELE